MQVQAVLDETAFNELPDEAVLGKSLFAKNEQDGKFYLDLPGDQAAILAVPLREENTRLKTHADTLLKEKKTASDALKAWQALGKTPDEIQEFLKTSANIDLKKITSDHEAEITRIKDSVSETLTAAEMRAKDAETNLESYMKRSMIAELKSKHGLTALADDFLANRIAIMPEAEGATKKAFRVIENGEIAYKNTAFKTPEQLIEEARENKDLQGLFVAGNGGGSGASARQYSSNGNSKSMSRAEFDAKAKAGDTSLDKFFADGGVVRD